MEVAVVSFRNRRRNAVTIPRGDVSTAYWSTKIPNIHTDFAMPPGAVRMMGLTKLASPLLSMPFVQQFVESQLDQRVSGPSAEVRARERMHVWARVTHADGRTVEGTAETPEGYRLTAMAAVECARRVLDAAPPAGYHTPSSALGAGFLESLPECDVVLGACVHSRLARRRSRMRDKVMLITEPTSLIRQRSTRP